MSSPSQHPIKLSWAERYRPERIFYLLLVSVILSAPASLIQAFIAQGPAYLAPSHWPHLYIVRIAITYPLPATGIALLALALALYGFRLDQHRRQKIAAQEKMTRIEESRSQFQPVHEDIQQINTQTQQIGERTAQIHHILTQQTLSTSSLIPVKEIKLATLNLGDDQSASFPYLSSIFPEAYEQATRIVREALVDAQQRGLLITGAPMAGKTRLAYQCMLEFAPDWLTLTWTRGLTAAALPAPEMVSGQRLILFLDDLQLYAESESGDEVAGTTNDLPLDRLYLTLVQHAAQVVIVATCRATDLSRAETTASLRWLFEKVQVVEIPFIPDERQSAVIDLLKATNATRDYHNDDFDSTLGSLLLGLSRKREQYLELKNQRHPGYLLLRAMKLLNLAGIPHHSKKRVRVLAIQAFGGKLLNDDLDWSTTCEALEERQFLTDRDNTLVIRKDVYFDKVITDYPVPIKLSEELAKVHRIFYSERDSEALLALGWTYSKRKEFSAMLETSTIVVELTPGNARAHFSQGTALMQLKRDEEALAAFEQAVTLDCAFAVGWNNKGFLLDNLARYEESLAAYDEALKLNPQYAGAWYNKGVTLDKLTKYDDALTAYGEATKLNPHFADAWYNKGIVLSRFSRNEEALTAFDEALMATTFDPIDARGWNTKAEMLVALQRPDEALAAFDKAIKLNQIILTPGIVKECSSGIWIAMRKRLRVSMKCWTSILITQIYGKTKVLYSMISSIMRKLSKVSIRPSRLTRKMLTHGIGRPISTSTSNATRKPLPAAIKRSPSIPNFK
jgi:tetratricopeptide (TPR) repeat protein